MQSPPMSNRDDAHLLQIVARQTAQDLPVDFVFGERGRVLAEAETAQPLGNVHGGSGLSFSSRRVSLSEWGHHTKRKGRRGMWARSAPTLSSARARSL